MTKPRRGALPPTRELTLGDLLAAFEEGAAAPAVAARLRALRAVPLGRLGNADLRFLIACGVAPSLVLPLALERLEHEPWLRAESRAGDLLLTLFTDGVAQLSLRRPLTERARALLARLRREAAPGPESVAVLGSLDPDLDWALSEALKDVGNEAPDETPESERE